MIVDKRKRRLFYLLVIFPLLVIGVFVFIISTVIYNSIPAFETEGLGIYTNNVWSAADSKFGGAAAIYGTFITSIMAVLISLPITISVAVFIIEIMPKKLRKPFSGFVDLLASFPTVIYGFWGLILFGPFLANSLFKFLHNYLGFLPLFSGDYSKSGASFLLASIILALMITPFSSSVIRETYSQIPIWIDEGVYSLGLGKWELIRIKLSYIKRAFIAAYALAFGRAVGETVAVSLTIGDVLNISPNLLSPGYTIPSLIVNQFGSAFGIEYNALFALALFLLVIGTAFIILSRILVREVR